MPWHHPNPRRQILPDERQILSDELQELYSTTSLSMKKYTENPICTHCLFVLQRKKPLKVPRASIQSAGVLLLPRSIRNRLSERVALSIPTPLSSTSITTTSFSVHSNTPFLYRSNHAHIHNRDICLNGRKNCHYD